MNPQFDSKTIETLKAARNQTLTATANPRKVNPVRKSEALDPAAPSLEQGIRISSQLPQAVRLSNGVKDNFAEEFIQKLVSIEQETAAVDEEIAKMEKIWLNLTEKKKQLENRRNELIKVRGKLKELDKEMSDVLSKLQATS